MRDEIKYYFCAQIKIRLIMSKRYFTYFYYYFYFNEVKAGAYAREKLV